MHTYLRRIAISTFAALAALVGSATISRSQNWQEIGRYGSMAECEAQIQVFRRANPRYQYTCVPISIPIPQNGRNSRKEVPEWLRNQWNRGDDFNRGRRHAYPYNEIYVKKTEGNGYNILDSYNPRTGEIVSRKFTQLSNIQEKSAIKYINEIGRKYPPGTEIANVPSVPRELRGTRLQGDKILEIPVQVRPIPQAILNAARNAKVIIRDINGRIYNP